LAESRRQEWAARVQRWKDSGLSATEFAAEMGLNPRTLSYWKWKLGRESDNEPAEGASSKGSGKPKARSRGSKKSTKAGSGEGPRPVELVEMTQSGASGSPAQAGQFELQTGDGRWRLRVPAGFDGGELRRLMAAMEGSR
jgi:hypothetical protein